MPGWQTNVDALFREQDIAGHTVLEIRPENATLEIGGMPAIDYFGDGSFYILDGPGHGLSHINALARTSTSPDTFIYMAADSMPLGGEFRPTESVPLPDSIDIPGFKPRPCTCEIFLKIHPEHSKTKPFPGLKPSFPDDLAKAERTIRCIQDFDADERVFVVFAHNHSLYDVMEFFPRAANDWKDKGRWTFLRDFKKAVELADG